MTVIYLDGVFFLNGLIDYLILLLTARLAGIPLRRRRYLLAALVGAVYAVAVWCPGWEMLGSALGKLAIGVLLAVISFGKEGRLLRLALLMLMVSCGLAGCVLGIGLLTGSSTFTEQGILLPNTHLAVLGFAALVVYGALALIFHGAAGHGVAGNLIPVRIHILGNTTNLKALWDSGNGLREPATRQPVLIVAPEVVRNLFPERLRDLVTVERLREPMELIEPIAEAEPTCYPHLLPFQTVGLSSGWLLAVRADWIEVGEERMDHAYIALSPTALGMGYSALWGGAGKKGRRAWNYY